MTDLALGLDTLLEIAGNPLWWIALFFVPFVNIAVIILASIDVAKAFGKGAGFGVGFALLSPIFYPILGFGSAQYQGASQQQYYQQPPQQPQY